MKFKTPKIFQIAQTGVNYDELEKYFKYMGVPDWHLNHSNAKTDSELLVEVAGRRCYLSFGTELNPNITRVREGNHEYIGNILKSKHGSVLEHGSVTFAVEDVSRIFTHELVRHRLCSYSQESMRFVRPTDIGTIFPQVYTDHLTPEKAEKVKEIFMKTFIHAEDIQKELVEIMDMDNAELPFAIKKLFQSANRRLIPDGMTTGIIFTANHRNLRHVTQLRTSKHAEEEIRYVFWHIYLTLIKMYPAIYQDASLSNPTELYGEEIWEVAFANEKI